MSTVLSKLSTRGIKLIASVEKRISVLTTTLDKAGVFLYQIVSHLKRARGLWIGREN